jgi:hypothetical protein
MAETRAPAPERFTDELVDGVIQRLYPGMLKAEAWVKEYWRREEQK